MFSYGFHKFLGHPAMRNRDFKTCGIIWLMAIENLDVNETLEKARRLLKEDGQVSPAIAAIMEVLILLVTLMANRLGRNSKNSHKPPSQDPNRARKNKAAGDVQKRRPGGQDKHAGCTLEKTETPDQIEEIVIDMRTIPEGRTYTAAGSVMTTGNRITNIQRLFTVFAMLTTSGNSNG